MSDTVEAPAIANHDCNAYCRPDEGLHCEVQHRWRPAEVPREHADKVWREQTQRQWGYVGPWPMVDAEPTQEAPPLPEAEWPTYWRRLRARGGPGMERTWKTYRDCRARGEAVYHGAYLVWFRVLEADRA